MFVSISRAVLALFLVTSTIATAPPVLQGRFHFQHHRHPFLADRKLESSSSNSCLDAFETFLTGNPALDAAYDASQDEFFSTMLNCLSLDDCNLDQDTWDSSATLSQTCNDAGGTIYKTSFTSSCEFSLDGVNVFKADIEVVNQHDCFPPSCTREHIVAAIEDYVYDEDVGVFEMQSGEDTTTTTTTTDLDGGCHITMTVADAEGMVIHQDNTFRNGGGSNNDGGGSNNDGGGSNNDGGGSNGSTSTATSGMLMLCVLVVVGLI